MLSSETSGTGPRLALAHGFTQTARFWDVVGRPPGHQVVAVDLPGHGGSPAYAAADLTEAAQLLGEVAGTATYVGYSLGGRICLHLALARPELVQALVLVGARPGLAEPAARTARAAADDALADRIERFDRAGLDRWLREEWLTGDLFRTLPTTAARVEERTRNEPRALAESLRRTSLGRQQYLLPRLGELRMPVLLVHGEHDRSGIVAEMREMAAAIGPNAQLLAVERCGHAVPFERPDAFAAAVTRFLATRDKAME